MKFLPEPKPANDAAKNVGNDTENSESYPPESHTPFQSKYKKAVVATAIAVLIALAIALPLAMRSGETKSNHNNVLASKRGPLKGAMIASSLSDSLIFKQQSAFGNNQCPPGEGLWNFRLFTDDYAFETDWQLLSDGDVIASGPPEGYNYADQTLYLGNLCLPVGPYVLKMMDLEGDGICCTYGEGYWEVTVNGEVVLESGEDDDYDEIDYPFEVIEENVNEKPDSVRFTPWDELLNSEKTAAEGLGFTEATWSTYGVAEVEQFGWWQLTDEQKALAETVGFNEDDWDCSVDHYNSYDWSELELYGIDKSFEILGWNLQSWNGVTDPPASDDKMWDELTSEEQDAAMEICYFRDNWDV